MPSMRRLVSAVMTFVTLAVAIPASAQMTESERKAAARAAYSEGVKLQEAGKCPEALGRFEAAQKLFDAPTHLVRIAECQEKTGRLVEASETYETLARKTLPAGSPEVFVEAQQKAQKDLPALRQRIPTLRVSVKPDKGTLQNLQIGLNGTSMPLELVGIARPINPGTYRLTATANGYATPGHVDVPLAEGETKSVELVLQPSSAPVVVVPPPPGTTPSPAPPPYERPADDKKLPPPTDVPTSNGLLLGARLGFFVPAGNLENGQKFTEVAAAGVGFGLDAMARVAKALTLGLTFEYAGLSSPDKVRDVPAGAAADSTLSTTYFGATLGVIPNIERVSFVGDVGLGYRSLSRRIEIPQTSSVFDVSHGGVEFGLGAGVSIPAGHLRFVPKASLQFGTFGSRDVSACDSGSFTCPTSGEVPTLSRASHVIFFVGMGLYYSLDLGKKPGLSASL